MIANFKHLFDRSSWRVKLEIFYYSCTFFWFNAAIVFSDIIFLANVITIFLMVFIPNLVLPFTFSASNIYIAQLLLFNWMIMILLYLLQIGIATASQFGQTTTKQIWLALVSYFTFTQLFLVVSVSAISSVFMDKILGRKGNKWVKTKRFND